MRSWVLYPPRWKTTVESGVGISSPTPNCGHEDKKQMEKCSSAIMYICFITWVITKLMYIIVIG